MMNISNKIQFFALSTLLQLTRIIPEFILYKIGFLIGYFYYFINSNRRELTLINLEIVFPNKSASFKKKLSKQIFRNFSYMAIDLLLITTNRLTNKKLSQSTEIKGREKLVEAINSNKGILVITGHLGNWELIPRILSILCNKQINVIARKSKNIFFEENFIKKFRRNKNVNIIYKEDSLIKFIKGFKNGDINGILIDQNQKNNQGKPVPFFNRDAFTTLTPALLQIKYKPICLPIFLIRNKYNKFEFVIHDPIEVEYPLNDENVIELTLKHQKILEDIILKYPDQWLWMHNRWNIKQ